MNKLELNPTVFYPRFAHITNQIFEQLDKKAVTICREVSKSWQEFVDEKNLPWIHIVKIPKTLCFGETYLHCAAKTGQLQVFGKLLESEEEKNPKIWLHETPLHLACKKGHFKIAELILQR